MKLIGEYQLFLHELWIFQEVDVSGIKFWCYTAGHVLGAAMFMIEIAGVKVHITVYSFSKHYSLLSVTKYFEVNFKETI